MGQNIVKRSAAILAEVAVELGERTYPIQIGRDCAEDMAAALAARIKPGRGVIVTNAHIGALWSAPVQAAFGAAGFALEICEISEGEEHKNLGSVAQILDFAIERKHTRQSVIIALGGGVVGDIAGFAAATLLRGVPFAQLPTTLLAMVDSSVGGKTGVNHRRGKNLIGAFWQPVYVGADLAYLDSLDDAEMSCGMAEIIKYGVMRDAALFEYIEKNIEAALARETETLTHLIRRSCEIKAEIVALDEREDGLRATLNLGHTFGHAVEALEHYSIRHGEGVGMGLVAASRLGALRGSMTEAEAGRVAALVARANLPVKMPRHDFAAYRDKMTSDKKSQRGKLRFVLPTRIGAVEIADDVTDEQLKRCIEDCTEVS